MKALLLSLTAIALSLVVAIGVSAAKSSGPGAWYYNCMCQQPADQDLHEWLAGLTWTPYEKDVYDCTEMSAYVEWLCENCGYDTVIGCQGEGNLGHCWVIVEGRPFETTGQYWVEEDHSAVYNYYNPERVYESVTTDPAWDWWAVHPELIGGE